MSRFATNPEQARFRRSCIIFRRPEIRAKAAPPETNLKIRIFEKYDLRNYLKEVSSL